MKVRDRLERTKAMGGKALIPYLVAGFPTLEESMEMLLELGRRGATAVELGIPFSDPMADGPVIQRAHTEALKKGTTPGKVLEALGEIKDRLRAPVILMTYYNPVFRMGEEVFARRAKEAGASGAIIPDLPPEEASGWIEAAWAHDLETVFLVAPNTPLERVRKIAQATTGFLYYLSLKGVTGSVIKDLEGVKARVRKIKALVDMPVCVGFGIKEPSEAEEILEEADGIVVGSSLLRALEEGGPEGMLMLFDLLQRACGF